MDDFDLEFDNDDDLGGDDDLSQKNGGVDSDDDEIPESQDSDGFATDDATSTHSCWLYSAMLSPYLGMSTLAKSQAGLVPFCSST